MGKGPYLGRLQELVAAITRDDEVAIVYNKFAVLVFVNRLCRCLPARVNILACVLNVLDCEDAIIRLPVVKDLSQVLCRECAVPWVVLRLSDGSHHGFL